MPSPSPVRYVEVGDTSLAYQVIGDGPVDIIECAGLFSHLEAKWDSPGLVRMVHDLARFARVILFDRRGVGLSDRDARRAAASLEVLADDVVAVLDAVGSTRATALGVADGGPIAAMLAARHPQRVERLVLYNSAALATDWPMDEQMERLTKVLEGWGSGSMAVYMGNEEERQYFARAERRACTQRSAKALFATGASVDLTPVLPTLTVPTLVMHYRDHVGIPVETARKAAAIIPDCQLLEVAGYTARSQVFGRDGLAIAVERFVTGRKVVEDADRRLLTLLFADIVASTEAAARVGHRHWRDRLDELNRRLGDAVEAATGSVVKNTGDGLLAAFDGTSRAARCAGALMELTRDLGLELRISLHIGECDRIGDDLAGLTVHVAARIMDAAAPGEILASAGVREALVGTEIQFEDRGEHTLRGVPGRWPLLAVSLPSESAD